MTSRVVRRSAEILPFIHNKVRQRISRVTNARLAYGRLLDLGLPVTPCVHAFGEVRRQRSISAYALNFGYTNHASEWRRPYFSFALPSCTLSHAFVSSSIRSAI